MTIRRVWVAVVVLAAGLAAAPSAHALSAGASTRSLVPPGHPPLAGYSKRHGKPSLGVHDAPRVRAVVLEEGGQRVAVAGCDLLIIDERLDAAVRRRVAQRGVRVEALIVAATHTHSGPGAYGHAFLENISMGRYRARVFNFLVEQISQAVIDAAARMEPVRLRTVTVPTSGLVVNRMEPDGPVGAEAEAVVLAGARGPIAMMVAFGAHPTTLGAWNRYLSADYPGVLARAMEARFPGSVCVFLAGSVADQAPVKAGIGFERAEWLGQALTSFVADALPRAVLHERTDMAAQQRIVPLPPASVRLKRMTLPGWISRRLADDDATLSVVRIGSMLWIAVPCDLSTELGMSVNAYARQRGLTPIIIGFADDYIGYCLPSRFYASGQYEALMMLNGPTTGDLLVEQLKQMLDRVVTSYK